GAQSLYADVHSERRAFRTSWLGIRAEAADVGHDAYHLALSQWSGAPPLRTPDFDKDMVASVPEPMDGVPELALARQAAATVREQVKDVRRRAHKARARLNVVRLDVLK